VQKEDWKHIWNDALEFNKVARLFSERFFGPAFGFLVFENLWKLRLI
jgi:hypothetical protein